MGMSWSKLAASFSLDTSIRGPSNSAAFTQQLVLNPPTERQGPLASLQP